MRQTRLIWQFVVVSVIVALVAAVKDLIVFQIIGLRGRGVQEHLLLLGTTTALVVLLILAAGSIQAVLFSRRLGRVLKAFEQLREGQYPKILVEGTGLLASLTRSFNQMVEELRNRDDKLKSWMGHRETEVIRLSQTLEEERKKLGTVLDSIGDGVIVLDSEGQVVMANRRVSEVFGVPLEMLSGTNLTNLIEQVRHRLVRPDAVEEKVRAMMRDSSAVDEITLELDEPGGQAIRLYCAPVRGADGKVLGRIATSLDLGREREMDRLKTEFLSTVSHELRTPLTSVKGSLGLIKGGAAGPVSSDVRELLEIAMANTDRLIRVITDILDIFQLERGQGRVRPETMTLAASVAKAVKSVTEAASQKGMVIETRLPERLPAVHADPRRVEQVLVNLLSNAVKFSPAQSTVVVAAHPEGREVVVSVQDSGRGMSKAFLDRMFQKFEHEQGALRRESQGAGLGLAICRHIVSAHRGRIWAQSVEGAGSTFFFTLPVAQGEVARAEQAAPAAPGQMFEPRLILVIDDDQDVARIISYVFESQGHRVITVHNGREAIAMARKHRPDMLTLDVNMPDIDGYDVLKALRSEEETRSIPIICISVEPEPGTALSCGANFFLEKPLDIDKLREVADRALATA